MKYFYYFLFLLFFSSFAIAENNCENVIALSVTRDTVIYDKNELRRHAEAYCSEYKKNAQDQKNSNFQAAYEKLSLTFGKSRVSTDEIAERYCSASSSGSVDSEFYRKYISGVDPLAYPAYQKCLDASLGGLKLNIDRSLINPNRFVASISFTSVENPKKYAKLEFGSSQQDIQCEWKGTTGNSIKLQTGQQTALTCNRANSSIDSGVLVYDADSSSSASGFHIPWKAFTAEGQLVMSMRQIKDSIDEINERLNNIKAAKYFEETFGELSKHHSHCNREQRALDGDLVCAAAIYSYCKAKDYAGGFPQRWDGEKLGFICAGEGEI